MFLLLLNFIFSSCTISADKKVTDQLKQEIRETEQAFAKMAMEEGVKEAFIAFAADDAVLNRSNRIISGKQAIKGYFDKQTLTEIKLLWEPEFIDVAQSGDLAYTYGPYTFAAKDSTGKIIEADGIFHTVWKRQPDGCWKYVYD